MTDAESPGLPIDPQRARRSFATRRVLEADDFVQRETARRMLDRLTTIRIDAARVLDLGCGSGADLPSLRERFAGATTIGLDGVMPRLRRIAVERRASGLARFVRRDTEAPRIQADFASLPIASKSIDVIWSNLALHWSGEPHRVLPEWSRVTRVGGLVAFSVFGPDTLREVVDAFRDVDGDAHVMPFTDLHDYGDMLIASGFATPVVDMERLTLTYPSATSLWRDVRALGGNALVGRSRSLHGRRFGRDVADALERRRGADGLHRLTFELIFAHAWKGEPRTTRGGETIVRVERTREGTR